MIALVPRDSLIGMIAGLLIWGSYFVVSYLISGIGCSLGYGEVEFAGLSVIQLLLFLAGGLAAALIVTAGIQAEAGRRHAKRAAVGVEQAAAQRRHQFLYTTALILCGLSLVGTLWLAMAPVIVPVC